MDFEAFLSKLDGVKGHGSQRSARCPAHEDKHQSLSVSQGSDKRILVKCQAGCSAHQVVSAMSLTMADLYSSKKETVHSPTVAVYRYCDADGELLAEKLRRADKSFTWRQPDKNNSHRWLYNRSGLTIPPYNLPDVIKSDRVYIVEGEKDVETLRKYNLVATTGADGAGLGKWRIHYNEWFRNKAVSILPDNDKNGMEYAKETAQKLSSVAKSVKLLDLTKEWPDLQPKGDISDIFAKNGHADTIFRLEALEAITAEYEPTATGGNDSNLSLEYSGSVRPKQFTDTDNTRIFADVYRGKAIYVTSLGWLVWDGKTWINDDLKATALAMNLTDRMLAEADKECAAAYSKLAEVSALEDSDEKKKAQKTVRDAESYRKHARNSRSRSKIDAMQNLARSQVPVKPDKLDANPYELNTPAGIVNLKSGQITPHDPEKLCTKITSCSPGQKGAALWKEFLSVVSCGDPKMENFLQQIAGMAAVGKVYEECVCMALGSGANGKSSFFNALAMVLNGYACRIDPGILIATNQGKNYDLAVLKGVRLAVAAETDESARLSSAGIKQLASTDKIYAERKYRDPEEFTPSHSLILYTNYAPRVGSTDNGTWRRIVLIPFDAKIKPTEDIKNYADYLFAEAGEAILSWIIEGAKNFIVCGHKLIKPEFIEMAIEEYQDQNDWMGEFLEEFCDMGQDNTAKAGTLYTTYHDWAKSAHGFARRTDAFGYELEKRGFIKRRTRSGILWHGLSLRPQEYSYSSQNYG